MRNKICFLDGLFLLLFLLSTAPYSYAGVKSVLDDIDMSDALNNMDLSAPRHLSLGEMNGEGVKPGQLVSLSGEVLVVARDEAGDILVQLRAGNSQEGADCLIAVVPDVSVPHVKLAAFDEVQKMRDEIKWRLLFNHSPTYTGTLVRPQNVYIEGVAQKIGRRIRLSSRFSSCGRLEFGLAPVTAISFHQN